MSMPLPEFVTLLRRELEARTTRNPRYSMRAMARSLGVDAGDLSRVLRGQRLPSTDLALRMISRLDLTEEEARGFLASVCATQLEEALLALQRQRFTAGAEKMGPTALRDRSAPAPDAPPTGI